jgi:hypothetical protein
MNSPIEGAVERRFYVMTEKTVHFRARFFIQIGFYYSGK